MASRRCLNQKGFQLVGCCSCCLNRGPLSAGFAKSDQVLDWIPAHGPVHHPESPLDAGTHGIDIDSHHGAAPWLVLEHVHCKYEEITEQMGQKVALLSPLAFDNQKIKYVQGMSGGNSFTSASQLSCSKPEPHCDDRGCPTAYQD